MISLSDFQRILKKCGVETSAAVLSSILSRFPRTSDGLINYTSFLQYGKRNNYINHFLVILTNVFCVIFCRRYGQNPQLSRERRKLKRFLLGLLPILRTSRAEWSAFLKDRFEKYDAKLHKVKRGDVSERGNKKNTIINDGGANQILIIIHFAVKIFARIPPRGSRGIGASEAFERAGDRDPHAFPRDLTKQLADQDQLLRVSKVCQYPDLKKRLRTEGVCLRFSCISGLSTSFSLRLPSLQQSPHDKSRHCRQYHQRSNLSTIAQALHRNLLLQSQLGLRTTRKLLETT